MATGSPERSVLATAGSTGLRPLRPHATRGRGLISAADVGASNRVAILQSLVEHGPLSRADLARLAGVPRGSVAPIVTGLLGEEFLVELPAPAPAGKGKPARPLWFGPRVGNLAAIQVRPGIVDAACFDQRGALLYQRSQAFDPDAGASHIEQVALELASTLPALNEGPLSGIGLVWPAVWDEDDGHVLECTPIPALVGSQLVSRLQRSTGLAVVVEDDARALAIGQRWFGQARGVDAFAAVQISTGIGAGIIVGGRLHQIDGVYPEVGHMCVDLRGRRCRCGRTGCWETVASIGWLREEAGRRGLAGAATLTPSDVVGLHSSSPAAAGLLADYAAGIAVGLANLAIVFGLPRFVLHGEVVGGGPVLLDLIERAVAERMTIASITGPVIELARLDQDAGLLGGAAAALTRALEHP